MILETLRSPGNEILSFLRSFGSILFNTPRGDLNEVAISAPKNFIVLIRLDLIDVFGSAPLNSFPV